MLNPSKFKKQYNGFKIFSDDQTISLSLEKLSNIILEFWTALALCHECSIQEDEDGREDYIGMSPDSIELVRAARLQGYQLTKSRTSKFRRIKTGVYKEEKISKAKTRDESKLNNNRNFESLKDEERKNDKNNNQNDKKNKKLAQNEKDFELLNTIAFTSDRKRESVIVKDNNTIKLYIKGADSIIEQRLSKNTNQDILKKCKECVNYFSSQGFRTLLIGMKILSQNEYNKFANELNEANMSLEDKDKKVEEIYNKIEQNIFLIGSTIVEETKVNKEE